jgi:hypothetical protein
MFLVKMSGLASALALAGLSAVAPASDAQESAGIQSQCRREAQDYGIAPEQLEEYVLGCVQAYGGVPEAAPEPPADGGAGAPVAAEPETTYPGEQEAGAALE